MMISETSGDEKFLVCRVCRVITHAFWRASKKILVCSPSFSLEGFVLEDVGNAVFRATAVNCLSCSIVWKTRESPSHVSEETTCRQRIRSLASLIR